MLHQQTTARFQEEVYVVTLDTVLTMQTIYIGGNVYT